MLSLPHSGLKKLVLKAGHKGCIEQNSIDQTFIHDRKEIKHKGCMHHAADAGDIYRNEAYKKD